MLFRSAERAPPPEWAAVSERLAGALGAGRFEEGLTNALAEVTALLEKHFGLSAGVFCVEQGQGRASGFEARQAILSTSFT